MIRGISAKFLSNVPEDFLFVGLHCVNLLVLTCRLQPSLQGQNKQQSFTDHDEVEFWDTTPPVTFVSAMMLRKQLKNCQFPTTPK
jgi:hypothetical protein